MYKKILLNIEGTTKNIPLVFIIFLSLSINTDDKRRKLADLGSVYMCASLKRRMTSGSVHAVCPTIFIPVDISTGTVYRSV